MMRGRSGIPSRWPTCSLPIEHPKLIVHALGTLMRLHRRRLLLLLRGEVPQHPVDGRHLDETPIDRSNRNLGIERRFERYVFICIMGTFLKCVVKSVWIFWEAPFYITFFDSVVKFFSRTKEKRKDWRIMGLINV